MESPSESPPETATTRDPQAARDLREPARHGGGPLVFGTSRAMREALAVAERVAATDVPVMLLGETGAGKGCFAEAIHAGSRRCARPMVRLNCAALPGTLVESELFGCEKGAFTGADTRRPGRFERANGSTLFLDEIAELPIELQAKLLRVLDGGVFERLGNPTPIRADVRIIAATNRDPHQAIAEGRLRSDLYYRLAVFPIRVPALREHPEDVPVLAAAFATTLAQRMGRPFRAISPESLARLVRHCWPGNVRELRNAVERALVLSDSPLLEVDPVAANPARCATCHVPAEDCDRRLAGDDRPGAAARSGADLSLAANERAHVLGVLERCGWRVRGQGGAARLLALPPSTLESRMARLGIRRPKRRA